MAYVQDNFFLPQPHKLDNGMPVMPVTNSGSDFTKQMAVLDQLGEILPSEDPPIIHISIGC